MAELSDVLVRNTSARLRRRSRPRFEAVLLAPYVWIPVEALHVRRLFVG